jgi:hypothetical protein
MPLAKGELLGLILKVYPPEAAAGNQKLFLLVVFLICSAGLAPFFRKILLCASETCDQIVAPSSARCGLTMS